MVPSCAEILVVETEASSVCNLKVEQIRLGDGVEVCEKEDQR